MKRTTALICVLTALSLASACDDSNGTSTPASPSPTTTPAATTTITITSSGVSPRDITVTAGSQVTFVNNDSRAHEMTSDPHPVHTDCPAINQAGFIAAGASGTTGALSTPRVCGFHDHVNPDTSSLRGTITITQ